MSCSPLARSALLERVRRAVVAKRLTPDQVAQRTGLHRRTIQRFLDGRTFSLETLESIEVALRIRVAGEQPMPEDSGAPNRTNLHQADAAEPKPVPVVGWDQAAQVLGMHRNTLHRRRQQHGDDTATPWWRSRESVAEWFEQLLRGGE
jgi:transcriptional regulator with XRE-family HTH domain